MSELVSIEQFQVGLFDREDRQKSEKLMHVMDVINDLMGSGTLKFAAEGTGKRWRS